MHHGLIGLALDAYRAAIDACDPARAIRAQVSIERRSIVAGVARIDLAGARDVRIVAIGKAAATMAVALSELLSRAPAPPIPTGLVITHSKPDSLHRGFEYLVGDHPLPGPRSFRAGRRLLDFLSGCSAETLVLFLLSGGSSALVEAPAEGLGAADIVRTNELLLRADIAIRDVNAIRKRLSALKGGGLARIAAPARQMTLVLSDVPPGDVQSVGSGPTVQDHTSAADALGSLESAGLLARVPPAVERRLRAGERPSPQVCFGPVHVLLDSRDAARAAARSLESHGVPVTLVEPADGRLEDIVEHHLSLVSTREQEGLRAVVSAGEVTLDVRGSGLGGRNQQTVLEALAQARAISPSQRELVVLSAGTDGRDGPTDAAGAVADLPALARAEKLGLDPAAYLRNNDAYHFLAPLGALIRTGPTGTNVRDVRIFLAR